MLIAELVLDLVNYRPELAETNTQEDNLTRYRPQKSSCFFQTLSCILFIYYYIEYIQNYQIAMCPLEIVLYNGQQIFDIKTIMIIH